QRLSQLSSAKEKMFVFFEAKTESTWIDDYGYLTDLKLQLLITDANLSFCNMSFCNEKLDSNKQDGKRHCVNRELRIRRFETKIKPEEKLHMETMLLSEEPLDENRNSIRLAHNLYRSIDQTLMATAECDLSWH
ncbi:MAG: hypothetical protein JKX81_20000, partial [Arenicella sp.]|nr:hypothetical protein [Arenicella sp.]